MKRARWGRRLALAAVATVALATLGVGLLAVLSPARPPAEVYRLRVPMPDGVRLAVDVVLPAPRPSPTLPAVLLQTRYWRSLKLRLPDQPGVPPVGPRDAIVDRLVEAGYAVVVADVRGTGASEGTWPRPWSEAEVRDGQALITWIAAQPWSDGRVGATGLSYEGTTALLTATSSSPALKAVLARDLEWDLVEELLAPGGVRNLSFVDAWDRSVRDLDANQPPELFPPSARWLVTGVQPVDDDPEGAALAQLVAARRRPTVAEDVANVRAPDDPFGAAGPPARAVGPSAHAAALGETRAKVSLWGGWWDGATADAVLRADAAMPLVEAVIGPWTHEGDASASPFGGAPEAAVELSQIVAFFDRHLKADTPAALRRRWWVAGAERWEEGSRWPTTRPMPWHLLEGGRLAQAPGPLEAPLEVDFAASTGKENRWNTGMLKPVHAGDRRAIRGALVFASERLPAPLAAFGAAWLGCEVALDGGAGAQAALHVYLEAITPSGEVRLLTEGVARVETGPVRLRLLPLAFTLPAGFALRVAVTGADADTFERVPASGPRRMTLRGPCVLELPVRAD